MPCLTQYAMKNFFHTRWIGSNEVVGTAVFRKRHGAFSIGAQSEARGANYAAFLLNPAAVGQHHSRDAGKREEIQITERLDHDDSATRRKALP